MGKPTVRILDMSWASRRRPMLEILPELMGQPMSVQTSCSRRNLRSSVVRTSAHSQTPPGSVGPVAPEGISGAMSSGRLHTPRHLQGVWDQLLRKESPGQCRLDVWTLPDTSRECGTSCSGRNLWSNVVWMSAHSQTPPGSVGPVAPEGISGAMSSGCLHSQRPPGSVGQDALEGISRAMSSGRLHTPSHLQGVWDQLLQKESPGQCCPDICTLCYAPTGHIMRCADSSVKSYQDFSSGIHKY